MSKKYIVAIPSYKREEIIMNKTLPLLLNHNINKDNIYIFVADKEEEEKYISKIPSNYYNKIIVGKRGISYQRNFIIDYFDELQKIVFIDDDISRIEIKKNNKVKDIDDLDKFFNKAFDDIEREKIFLWTTKNMYNPFYKNLMKEEGEIGLVSFSGDLMGIINRKDMKIKLTLKKGEAEQKELLFKYYKRDGGILRYNNVVVISAKLSKGGKVAERGSVEDRKKDILPNLKILEKAYPEYVKKIDITPDKDKTFRGRATLEIVNVPSRYIKGAGKNEVDDEIYNDIFYFKINKDEKYQTLKKELYELLENSSIPKIEGPRNDGRKTRGDLLGFDAYTITFGSGSRRNLGVGEFSANFKKPELFQKLIEYGNFVLPKGVKYSAITLNKDMKAKKHIDGGNAGFSFITGLGDFEGGNLLVYPEEHAKPYEYNLKDHLLSFNGSKFYHQTTKFTGRRYTLIYYNQKKSIQIKGKKMEGQHKYNS